MLLSGQAIKSFVSNVTTTVVDSALRLTVLCDRVDCNNVSAGLQLNPAVVRIAAINVHLHDFNVLFDNSSVSANVLVDEGGGLHRSYTVSLILLEALYDGNVRESAMNISQSSIIFNKSLATVRCVDVCAAVYAHNIGDLEAIRIELLNSTFVHQAVGTALPGASTRRVVSVDFQDVGVLRDSLLLFCQLHVSHSALSGTASIADALDSLLMGVASTVLRLPTAVNVSASFGDVTVSADVSNGTLPCKLAALLVTFQLQVSLVMTDKRYSLVETSFVIRNSSLHARTGFFWPKEALAAMPTLMPLAAPIASASIVSLVSFFANASKCAIKMQRSTVWVDHMRFPKAPEVDAVLLGDPATLFAAGRLVQFSNFTALVLGADFGALLESLSNTALPFVSIFIPVGDSRDKFETYLAMLAQPVEYIDCTFSLEDSELRYPITAAQRGGFIPNPLRDILAYFAPPMTMARCSVEVTSAGSLESKESTTYYTVNGITNIVGGVIRSSSIVFRHPPTAIAFAITVFLLHAALESTNVTLHGVRCTVPEYMNVPQLDAGVFFVAPHAKFVIQGGRSFGGALNVSGSTVLDLDNITFDRVAHMFWSFNVQWTDNARANLRCVGWQPEGAESKLQHFFASDVNAPMGRIHVFDAPARRCSRFLPSLTPSRSVSPSFLLQRQHGGTAGNVELAAATAGFIASAFSVVADLSSSAVIDAQLFAAIGLMDCSPVVLKSTAASRITLSPFYFAGFVAAGLGNVALMVVFGLLHWTAVRLFGAADAPLPQRWQCHL